MNLSELEINEANEVADLLSKIDKDWDEDYVNTVSDEIFQHQPFFLTALLGLRFDVTPEELEEIMKIYFFIWEYFKNNKKVFAKKVTEEGFEKVQKRHIEMLRYMEGEPNQKEKGKVVSSDFDNFKSRSLLAAVLLRYSTRSVLVKMNKQNKGFVFVGIKSFIECFDNL